MLSKVQCFLAAAMLLAPSLLSAADRHAMPTTQPDNDLAVLTERLAAEQSATAPDAEAIRGHIRLLGEDGRFRGVDYRNVQRSGWPTARHLSMLNQMAAAWRKAGHPLAGDADLGRAVRLALGWWLKNDPVNPNWWWNEIGVPMSLGRTGVMLGSELSDAERAGILKIMARAKIGMTGQNLVWLAGNRLMAACLSGDAAEAARAARAIAGEIHIAGTEGLQADFTFHQHGAQLYSGGYGRGFAIDGARWSRLTAGTRFAIPQEKVQLLARYLLDGEQWSSWGNELDMSVCGREIVRAGNDGRARGFAEAADNLAAVSPADAKALGDFAARIRANRLGGPIGHRSYWRSDYVVHRRADWFCSVRMCSTRMLAYEIVNDEGLLSYHVGDGLTCLMRTGAEYRGVFPVWDWHRLPGVTCAADGAWPKDGRYGTSSFVGGVDDGHSGVAAMDAGRDGVQALKAWFMFDDAVVCLGAGITCKDDRTIVTTLNQCRLAGPVTFLDGDEERSPKYVDAGLASAKWGSAVLHDGVGYWIAPDCDARVQAGPRPGNWRRISGAAKPDPVTHDLFTLWIDHGRRPGGARYAYALLPGADAAALRRLADKQPFEILANTDDLQAVRHAASGLTGVVFHQAGRLAIPGGVQLEVDKPCLALLNEKTGRAWLADPTQKLRVVTVTLGGREVRVELPRGQQAGSSVSVELGKP